MVQFLGLPDDALRNVCFFLPPPDLLHFLTSHPHVHQLSMSESFWRVLNGCTAATTSSSSNNSEDEVHVAIEAIPASVQEAKRAYLTRAYVNALPVIRWRPCLSSRLSPTGREGHLACTLGKRVVITGGFTDDEHVYVLDTSSQLSQQQPLFVEQQQQLQVVDWQKIMPTEKTPWRHPNDRPPPRLPRQEQNQQPAPPNVGRPRFFMNHHQDDDHSRPLEHVYGASLTALDDRRAVRFGGFRGGGYTGECAEVAVLTIDNNDEANNNNERPPLVKAIWQKIHAQGSVMPRAYHSATLVANRYLVVVGGMASSGCIRGEAILDTETWTWLNDAPVTHEMKLPKPTARHGHSAVLDEKRNRIVIFGGGSGSDLLRSGRDNAEVWELCMGPQWKTATNAKEFQGSLPWEWGLVLLNDDSDDEGEDDDEEDDEDDIDDDDRHYEGMVAQIIDNMDDMADFSNNDFQDIDGDDSADDYSSMPPLETRVVDNIPAAARSDDTSEGFATANGEEAEPDQPLPPIQRGRETAVGAQNNGTATSNNNNGRGVPNESAGIIRNPNRLLEAEKLCLGRCHLGFKVSPDTVVLAFGSGRPSTNRVMGFNLAYNTFFRPKLGGGGMLPPPRFTAAGALFGEYNSYLLVHGGYSSQEGVAIGNISTLDLAAVLDRELLCLPENPDLETSPPVTGEDVNRYSLFGHNFGPHGAGIGGMEDLLQNLFVELAAGAGGNRREAGALGRGRALGDILGRLGGRQEPDDDDEDDDDDESDDDDDPVPGGLGGAEMMFNMIADGVMFGGPGPAVMMGGDAVGVRMHFGPGDVDVRMHFGPGDDDDDDDDDESGYESGNISEIS